jgi:hypothetical protein
VSNIPYLVFGLVFLVLVRLFDESESEHRAHNLIETINEEAQGDAEAQSSDVERERDVDAERDGKSDDGEEQQALIIPTSLKLKGLHRDYSLYYCLGWALVIEGVFSALYHVCPSRTAFQFDMTFMIVGTGLLYISFYQKRRPTLVPGAFNGIACCALA